MKCSGVKNKFLFGSCVFLYFREELFWECLSVEGKISQAVAKES